MTTCTKASSSAGTRRENAAEAVERSKVLEGFRDYPDGYLVMEIEVDDIYFRMDSIRKTTFSQHPGPSEPIT
jgi:hypothetical protein